MEFLENLPEGIRSQVRNILHTAIVDTQKKLDFLKVLEIPAEIVQQASQYLNDQHNELETAIEVADGDVGAGISQVVSQVDLLNEDNFLRSIACPDTKNLVSFLLDHKLYRPADVLISKESEEARNQYIEWCRKLPDFKDDMMQQTVTSLMSPVIQRRKFCLKDMLEHMSSDQRKVLLCTLIKNKQWKTCEAILKEESQQSREAFDRWKNEHTLSPSPPDELEFVPPINGDATYNAHVDHDDADSDMDPTEWTPSIEHDFFDKFPKQMNILVLGETGVGKSTFINGLANYLRYSNLHEAKKNCEILIKAHFTYSDKDYNLINVVCDPTVRQSAEEVANEVTDTAKSSTQFPKSYCFSIGPSDCQKAVCIIDTPGVGDDRGIEQERKNFGNILSYISNFKEIHAILILMKPNEPRLTPTFRYCINELLTHLHKSASRNVIFCFTNSRQTWYGPGDTQVVLQEYLQHLSRRDNISIPLNNSTQFYFDSEAFRFLCAMREGVNFDHNEVDNFNHSWQHSVRETFRLFKQIKELPVHRVEDTLSINNIRSVIFTISRPLAEIVKNQTQNALMIRQRIQEIEDCIKYGHNFMGKLYVEQVTLEVENLDHPRTVCAASCCVEIVKLKEGDETSPDNTVYKTVCHDNCELQGVQTAVYPNPDLKTCYVFQHDENQCKNCGCGWESHLHITYNLAKRITRVLDMNIEGLHESTLSQKEKGELFLKNAKEKRDELEKNAQLIRGYCAEFAAFLKAHSLLSYNDAYTEYVELLITEVKNAVKEGGSTELLEQLEMDKTKYSDQISLLESQGGTSTNVKSIKEIYAMVEELKQNSGTILTEIQKLEWINLQKQNEVKSLSMRISGGWLDEQFNNGNVRKNNKKRRNNQYQELPQTPKSATGFFKKVGDFVFGK